MKWLIPAKTFLLGEYVALTGAGAFVVTTTPYFALTLRKGKSLAGIHPQSPAGRFWLDQADADHGLAWFDPYHRQGGMGASSAQFLAAYAASRYLQKKPLCLKALDEVYLQYAWQGRGISPSGYDVLAQAKHGCVYIHREQKICQAQDWPFVNIAFILVRSGKKLATHAHLVDFQVPANLDTLAAIVAMAKIAYDQADHAGFTTAINAYHQNLLQLQLVAPPTLQRIEQLRHHPEVLAIKGCGALGADVILLVIPHDKLAPVTTRLFSEGWQILATSNTLSARPGLIENNLD